MDLKNIGENEIRENEIREYFLEKIIHFPDILYIIANNLPKASFLVDRLFGQSPLEKLGFLFGQKEFTSKTNRMAPIKIFFIF